MEEEELSIDSILKQDEIDDLFVDIEEETQPTPAEEEETNPQEGDKKDKKETTEVTDVNDLFTDEPESVGSDEDNSEDQEGTNSEKDKGTSPKNKNFYSSIALALNEEGILPDLDEETIKKISAPEDLSEAIEKQITARLDEKQKRIDAALNAGMEPDEIKRYENTLNYLSNITEEAIMDEGEQGEKLRKSLIYQDFINKGYSQKRALREVEKSIQLGSDTEDAKEALASNKEFFQGQYDDIIEEAKQEEAQEAEERKKQAETLKKTILEDKNVFGDIAVDKATRQKAFDNIAKPVYRDPETGDLYTAIQKYERDNKAEFLKNLSLVFTLTDGFKNIDKLVKPKVRKEMKKGFRELEHTLNGTARTSDGNLKFVSGVTDDPESQISFELDI